MAKSTKKSTRKFEKNHLHDTIERRKAGAKIKQKVQTKAKRQARNAKEAESQAASKDGDAAKPKREDKFGEMSVDEFFQGGFQVPNELAKPHDKKQKARKRKRTENDEGAENSDSSAESVNGVSSDEDEDAEEEDVGMSKDAMAALSRDDPEFYKFLQDNDPEALDFDETGDFPEIDAMSASEEDDGPKKKKVKTSKLESSDTESSDVTIAMVEKWRKAMIEQHSLRAMRQVVLAFRAAAHVNEDGNKEFRYTISSPKVYHELLMAALQHVPEVLNHHLPVKQSAAGKVRVSTDSKKFKTLTPLLKSHIASIQHLMQALSDPSTLKITLSAIEPLLPYLLPFRKSLKAIMSTIVDVWSDASSTEATRITAFLVLRRMMVIGDPGLREAVLKLVYQGLIKSSRTTTIHTITGINLMKNSAAELWGLDQGVGYTTGFTFIRQLAIHLRTSIKNNQNEAYKAVYNWQYVHSLDFWSCVLSEHCNLLKEAELGKEAQLRPLIYPLVQVTLGAMRLIPTSTYFPLRFHLMRSLLRLSRATGTYIPLASILLEVLNSAEMKKPPKASTLKSLDFATSYKAQKSYLHTRVYQDGVGEQVAELLTEFFVLWSTSIAFPELALPVIVMIKRWMKEACNKNSGNKNAKVNASLGLVVQKLEANTKWIQERRTKVDFAPNNRSGVDNFLKGFEWEKTPLGAYAVGQRKQREEKAKLLEESRVQEERRRVSDKKKEAHGKAADDMDVSGDEELTSDDDVVE